jgi:hypothetical protein
VIEGRRGCPTLPPLHLPIPCSCCRNTASSDAHDTGAEACSSVDFVDCPFLGHRRAPGGVRVLVGSLGQQARPHGARMLAGARQQRQRLRVAAAWACHRWRPALILPPCLPPSAAGTMSRCGSCLGRPWARFTWPATGRASRRW